MPQALLLMIVIVVISCIVWAVYQAHVKNAECSIEYKNSWANVSQVQDLIVLYNDIAIQHGPDSQLAKSFKFGVDNDSLWKSRDSLASFHEITNVFDETLRRNKKMFKWN